VYADKTNRWTAERNTSWNRWGAHPALGYVFLRDPAEWLGLRWNPNQLMDVRIMGGMKYPENRHQMHGEMKGEIKLWQ